MIVLSIFTQQEFFLGGGGGGGGFKIVLLRAAILVHSLPRKRRKRLAHGILLHMPSMHFHDITDLLKMAALMVMFS